MPLEDTFRLLNDIVSDIATAPDGISTSRLAERHGLSRRVMLKYINILERAGIPVYTERKKYYLDDGYYLKFAFSAEENEIIYLALSWIREHGAGQWGFVQRLLRRISGKLRAEIADELTKLPQENPSEMLDEHLMVELIRAKQDYKTVWVEYRPLHRNDVNRWKINPYWFIKHPFSDGLYVICDGVREGTSNVMALSLKLNRITALEVTKETFSPINTQALLERIKKAWGVWGSQDDNYKSVILEFDTKHYQRLSESLWHPTQRIEVLKTGIVRFSVMVSEPNEMITWIRGWGSGVKVIAPDSLRQQIVQELYQQIQLYASAIPELQVSHHDPSTLVWAKYTPDTGAYHLLLYHMQDVGAVAWVMWERVLSVSQRQWVCDLLGMNEASAQQWVSFLAALHDIGKATPDFQCKAPQLYEQLLATGIPDVTLKTRNIPHGVSSAHIIKRFLKNRGLETPFATRLGLAIGGHHGEWISATDIKNIDIGDREGVWDRLQDNLCDQLAQAFDLSPLRFEDSKRGNEIFNVFTMFISGFTSVCDWIGSMDAFFSFESSYAYRDTYFERAKMKAESALTETGWFNWQATGEQNPFEQVFGFEMNEFQRHVISHIESAGRVPQLVMIEYLTGGGKTEASLYLADMFINALRLAGIYVAMPTQATSNQMFGRVESYLKNRYPHRRINLHLIHSQSQNNSRYLALQMARREGNENAVVAESWFQNKKRAILSPFAVGTVDQSMLGVLQARHHFVRLFGLSHKVIIFDEIHAYDTYMSTIIDRLIQWLGKLNSPTILLSATLPSEKRQSILSEIGVKQQLPDVSYPRMTIVYSPTEVQVVPLLKPETRTVYLQHIGGSIDELGSIIASVYTDGGCIAIICNTVNEAIITAQYFRGRADIDKEDVLLFHAHYPQEWRKDIEASVLGRFSKTANRPQRAILIATQIIEQSLDLDFDLLVTRTAPIDLMIQRMGRLHRHERTRPSHLSRPTLLVRAPESFNGEIPNFSADGFVYEPYILLKTWLLLRQIDEMSMPDDIDAVIEFVYSQSMPHGLSDSYSQAIETARLSMDKQDAKATYKSKEIIIQSASSDSLIGQTTWDLPDEPTSPQFPVQTRDMDSAVDILCLHQLDNQLSYEPDRLAPCDLDTPFTSAEVRQMLQYKITIQSKQVKYDLQALLPAENLAHIPQLRDIRILIFHKGVYRIPNSNYLLKLSRFYGLEIIKEGE